VNKVAVPVHVKSKFGFAYSCFASAVVADLVMIPNDVMHAIKKPRRSRPENQS